MKVPSGVLFFCARVCDNFTVKISAVIIAYNESMNIEDCIRSVDWADEILVVDSESSDDTREKAELAGARVIVQKWLGFSAQKQFAVDTASNDLIFSLDADERVSPLLRDQICSVKGSPSIKDGYLVPRSSVYMGRVIRHGGWYPDYQMRLFKRESGRWNSRLIHESFALNENAECGKLSGDLIHFSVRNAESHARMIAERYAPLSAKQMHSDGRRTSLIGVIVAGPVSFFRSYILKLGFLDGFPGYCIARFAATNAFQKHLMLLELQGSKNG